MWVGFRLDSRLGLGVAWLRLAVAGFGLDLAFHLLGF